VQDNCAEQDSGAQENERRAAQRRTSGRNRARMGPKGPPMHTRRLDPQDLGLPRRRRGLDLVGALPPAPRLAIVGARAARRRWAELVPTIVSVAAQRGFSVISGGALGIDTAVHRAALALDVPQLAILPAAVDRPYPPGNAELFATIAAHPRSGVAYVLRPGESPSRGLFVGRNSFVVALSAAVVVVQAGLRSGSIGSGRLALKQRRPLAALLGTPGCAALVGEGARAIATSSAELVAAAIDAWLRDPSAPPAEDPWPPHLRDLEAALGRAGERGLAIDDLDDPLSGLIALTEAESLDLVVEIGGRYIRRDQPPKTRR